jgi:hypothetical protein
MISLKKGSAFEDLALIQELSDTISYLYGLKDSIFNLSKALLVFNLNDLCIQLQGKYEQVIDLIDREKNEIWNWVVSVQSANSDSNEHTRITYDSLQANIMANLTEYNKLGRKTC